jgi:hypothetical protein
MPAILERLVSQLKAKGKGEKEAYAIATATLQRSGSLKRGTTQETAKGKRRSAMGAAGRAKDRAAKTSGHKPSDYRYNQLKNTARLKK